MASGWFAINDGSSRWRAPAFNGSQRDAFLTRGTLIIETRAAEVHRPRPLVQLRHGTGQGAFHLSLQALPGGGLSFVLNAGEAMAHHTFTASDTGRSDGLLITYTWDMSTECARISLESDAHDRVDLVTVAEVSPVPVAALLALTEGGEERYLSPELRFIAISNQVEPIGLKPGLSLSTPVATASGYQPISTLQRGDLVRSASGDLVPVLHVVERNFPALGQFTPLRIRAPYFGLRRDICVAPFQKFMLSGSEVEYLFGREAVLIRPGHLTGGAAIRRMTPVRFVTYRQLILPDHETLDAMGASVESLFLGRIRRKPDHLAASALAPLDRSSLPEHAPSTYPLLSAFDAVVLAEHRAA